jgi:hypothetical protein
VVERFPRLRLSAPDQPLHAGPAASLRWISPVARTDLTTDGDRLDHDRARSLL